MSLIELVTRVFHFKRSAQLSRGFVCGMGPGARALMNLRLRSLKPQNLGLQVEGRF